MIKAIQIYISLIIEKLLSISVHISNILRFITPYIIILLLNFYDNINTIAFFIPVAIWVVTSVFNIYLNRKGIGGRFPIPDERFTENVGDGEIRIKNDRLQELILYTNRLENWFRNNGYTDK